MNAAAVGISGDAFWDASTEELAIQFEGAAQREARFYELLMSVAWHAALWSRVKKFPTWESVRPKPATEERLEPARQSWQEMKALMKQLTATEEKKPAGRHSTRKGKGIHGTSR